MDVRHCLCLQGAIGRDRWRVTQMSTMSVLRAQTNRTLSVSVTALDEAGQASQLKAQPVIGMWAASDPDGSVPGAFTHSPFSQVPFGLTRLDANILTSSNFLIGIADMRGDGRPDYRYHAHVLYADSVWPARVGVNGGAITLLGTGFSQGLSSRVGGKFCHRAGGHRHIPDIGSSGHMPTGCRTSA